MGSTRHSPWQSLVTSDFWHALADLKLDVLQLSERPLQIQGYFTPCNHAKVSVPLRLSQESLALELGNEVRGDRNRCPAPGTLYNTNTMDEFKSLDREELINKEAQKIWEDICSGRAELDCKLLNRFFVISYADLKDWKFSYMFCFPAFSFSQPEKYDILQLKRACDYFSNEELSGVVAACWSWRQSPSTTCLPFFLLHLSQGVVARPLTDWQKCQEDGKVLLGFFDPTLPSQNPGWPLRNFLVLAAARWGLKKADAFCYRELQGRPDAKHSLVAAVSFEGIAERILGSHVAPSAVGWQSNVGTADLAASMDPRLLSMAAADLNLKLMKWRSFPSLDLELIRKTKCLLLGAGTLGCEVALKLLAWGVRDVSFVDYGKVGQSNPLRQSLYCVEDCRSLKAEAAPKALRSKCVDVRAHGHHLAIPMAGHSVSESQLQETLDNFNKLKTLIEEHDVIFLLTDTRESRWLPTVLCAASDVPKIVINAAVGFDSFVVMRHGDGPLRCKQEPRLGCYFCTDIVAPTDSTLNRTLDQQCTVSRPGVAPIAGALAVEMALALLHHPLGVAAPADGPLSVTERTDQPLGLLPHQIRSFLSHYQQVVVSGPAFHGCTACSSKVVLEFKARAFDFVLEALNSPNYLEDLTGLTELVNAADSLLLDWDGDEEEDAE